MSGSGDEFGEDTAKLENVRQLRSSDYLREYTGVLAKTNERVRILTLAPGLVDIDAAVDAFTQVSDQWYNASANATILTVRDRGTEPRPWIAVPDHDSDTLATLQSELSPDAVETVISETADALRTLGLYNTVHGHISPEDIYLTDALDGTKRPSIYVGGFGLEAAISAAVGEFEPTAYTAPELLDAPNQPTEQADVYGLGAVTYFALTGTPPIEGTNLDQAIRYGHSVPPSAYEDAIPAVLDDAVMQALSTRPDDRYESPYAFSRAFLSAFTPDDFRSDDAAEASGDEARTADSTESAEDDNESPSDEDGSADEPDTDETSVSRRAVVGLLGVGVLGGAGWYLSRGQLTATNPADQTTTSGPPATTPGSPADPSASISVPDDVAEWSTRRQITIESGADDLVEYPVVLESVDIGGADIESVRVVNETEGEVVDYATQSDGDDVDVAFQADIGGGETVERFSLYYGNDDADDEAEEWETVRYHWYDSFEDESGTEPENWTMSEVNPPAELSVDCTSAADGSCSMYADGQYVSEDSSIGNVESLPNRQYTLLEFDIRHVRDATQIRLTSEDTVASGGGFDTTRIKYGEVDQFYTGDPVDIEYETWQTFRYEFTWDGDDVGWTHYLNDEEIDSVPTSENTDVEALAGVIFRQAAFGDGVHYVDNVKFFASASDDLEISVGESESF